MIIDTPAHNHKKKKGIKGVVQYNTKIPFKGSKPSFQGTNTFVLIVMS